MELQETNILREPIHSYCFLLKERYLDDALLSYFSPDSFQEVCIRRIQSTCIHEVLLDQDSQFICKIIKEVRFVNSYSPDTKHVHVGWGSRSKEMINGFVCHLLWKNRRGNKVTSLHEHRVSIHFEVKGKSIFWKRILNHFNCPESIVNFSSLLWRLWYFTTWWCLSSVHLKTVQLLFKLLDFLSR